MIGRANGKEKARQGTINVGSQNLTVTSNGKMVIWSPKAAKKKKQKTYIVAVSGSERAWL